MNTGAIGIDLLVSQVTAKLENSDDNKVILTEVSSRLDD